MSTDRDLLWAYARRRDEQAFALLIERYLRLVYAACWRQLRDRHLAEDATQAVFVLLSRKAGAVRAERLAGWLLTAARFICAAMRKSESRRVRREEAAAMREEQMGDVESQELLALLDEGLWRLSAGEREAVARRYFQEQSLKEVGEGLAISEEAARKRVDRAVEKLRAYFARRGIVQSGAFVVGVMAAHHVSAAAGPGVSAGEAIVQACRGGGSGAALTLAKEAQAMMTAAKLKMAATLTAMALAAAGAGFAVRAVSQARAAAPAAPALVAASAPATSPALNLATPRDALISFLQALRAGDRDQAYACLLPDPKRAATEFDGCVAWALAQGRMLAAGKQRFPDAPPNTLLGGIGIEMFGGMPNLAEQTITGDSATLVIPAAKLAKLTDEPQELAWGGQPLRFKKVGAAWKLDIDHCVTVKMTMMGAEEASPAESRARNVKLLTDLGGLFDQIARQIADKTLTSPLDVRVAIRSGALEVFQKDGGTDMQCTLAPTGADASQP